MSLENELKSLGEKYKLTQEQCKGKIEEISDFISDLSFVFGAIVEKTDIEKIKHSLKDFNLANIFKYFLNVFFKNASSHFINIFWR